MTGVTGFEISYPPGGSDLLMVQPVSLKVTLQRKGNTGYVDPETYTYRRTAAGAAMRRRGNKL